jgi:regulator of cell morphogenesis and NO signaling
MTANHLQDLSAAESVGEWVATDFRLASVFSRHGIDFCCGGGKAVDQACAEKGVSLETLLQEVQAVHEAPGLGEQYNQWAIDFLADYVISQFHPYTKEKLAQIGGFADTVARVHGAGHPETVTIAALWRELRAKLAAHLRDEEELLFPYIKQMAQRAKEGGSATPPSFGSAEALIAQMGAEHDEAGDALGALARLSSGYTVPADGCNTYRALYGFLSEFEATTKKHIHLENNILFPKTVRLEQEQARVAAA